MILQGFAAGISEEVLSALNKAEKERTALEAALTESNTAKEQAEANLADADEALRELGAEI